MICYICGKDHPRGIGATSMPRILGLVPKTNALDIYHKLTRPRPEEDREETIDTLRGHRLEPDAASDYWRITGRSGAKSPGPTTHPKFPAFQVHLDYKIHADKDREKEKRGTGNLELKAPRSPRFDRILSYGLFQSELIQTWTQTAVARYGFGSLAFYCLEHNRGPLYWLDQVLDPKMGKFLLETGQRFWDEHVIPRVAPNPKDWELFEKEGAPKLVELGGDLVQVIEEEAIRIGEAFVRARDLKKEGEALYEKNAAEMLAFQKKLGEKRIQLPNGSKFSLVQKAERVSLSVPALRLARPLDWDLVRELLLLREVSEEDVDELLGEMELDLARFEREGNPSEYVLPPRAKKND